MNIDKLKSVISGRGGVAVPNRFRVIVLPPPAALSKIKSDKGDQITRDLEILCENCTLPGRQITTVDYQLLQQSYKIPSGFSTDEVSFSFILTNDYFAKKIFEAWAESAVDFVNYKAKYMSQYAGHIEIHQLTKGLGADGKDKSIYSVRLDNAFPTSLAAVTLDNSAENTVQKFTVTMAYENFTILS